MLKFYYAPWSRSSGVLWLLDELGMDYQIEQIDIRAEGGAPESYREIQPNKKVPAIEHGGLVITERAAITVYLADAFPQAGLAPAVEDPARGPYLTWNIYCDSVLDPCVAARAHGLAYKSNDYSFGLFEDMVRNVEKHLSRNSYAAGESFTAADTQLASAIGYTMNMLKILPERPAFKAYMARIEERPVYQRYMEKDRERAMALPFFQTLYGGSTGQ